MTVANIKYYGFDFPPVGIIDVLNRVIKPRDAVFYILDPLTGVELPYEELAEHKNVWVIITTHEGASHLWFDKLIPKLVEFGVPHDRIVLRSACLWDPHSPIKNIHTIVDECTDFVSTLPDKLNTMSPTHHFVCLNRLHRWQRFRLVKEILDRGLDQFGKISYLTFPKRLNDDRFPIVLNKSNVDWHDQRDLNDPAIAGALFNVITESAYEPEPNAEIIDDHYLPGMTEKSYKCFAMFQIPIWLAPYRAVACYRYLGFDVFDDVVDHSYDLEPDPERRIILVADQVEKITQLSQDRLHQFKQQFSERFEHNLKTLKTYSLSLSTELPQWKSLFLDHNLI